MTLCIFLVLFSCAVAIKGDNCNPTACVSKHPGIHMKGEALCRAGRDYIACQQEVIAQCNLDDSTLEPVYQQMKQHGCNVGGKKYASLLLVVLCLFLTLEVGLLK